MILFDFDTRSRWKRRPFDPALVLDNAEVHVKPFPLAFERIDVPVSSATRNKYAKERARLFANLGARDPHILPRQLYLIGGKDKLAYIERHSRQPSLWDGADAQHPGRYVARNKRLGRECIITYDQVTPTGGPYTILELPHRFIDFSDYLRTTWQARTPVLVADLRVDQWYFSRYSEWRDRLNATYASLQQS